MVPYPMMVLGVNRKVNTGNFENIDVYAGVGIPVMTFPHEDLEAFKEAVLEAADLGFSMTSRATYDRYAQIKEMQAGKK